MSDPTPKDAKRSKSGGASAVDPAIDVPDDVADWQRRVVGRSLRTATKRSIDRGATLINAAATLLERRHGRGISCHQG